MTRRLIGEILVSNEACTQTQIDECIAVLKSQGNSRRLGEILVERGHITEDDLLEALGLQLGVPFVREIQEDIVDKDLLSKVPINFAKKHRVMPLYTDDGTVTVAVADPMNMQALDDIALLLHKDVEIMISRPSSIIEAINACYHQSARAAQNVVERMQEEEEERGEVYTIEEASEDLLEISDKAPIIKLVNVIILQALKERASDIHFEAYERDLVVRYRIDGVLYKRITPPKHYHAAIVSRIKIMAKLNIAEKRLPQDGKISIRVANREVDIRVSVIPTIFGERVVLRLLDRSSVFIELEELGVIEDVFERFTKLIKLSHGIILVTGPTGSGKTTTLYAALSRINAETVNIITVEDPVEYQLPGIAQIQVKPKINLTFANGLRSILRQDPDVVMVGEIRDYETAEIATHASLTGHLVFSTLHTNDSAGAITRLIDMGIEPYLVSSSVIAIAAQRLVRRICPHCKAPLEVDEVQLREIGLTPALLPDGHVFRGAGCNKCLGSGYMGRTAIFELLVMDSQARRLTLERVDSGTIKEKAVERGMRTLRADGARKVALGETTIDEVLRVTQEDIL
ncbi:MAG: type II secretion system ATPase GspE [Verrucomicrobia bacterium]|nr:type II secretion system ATPase GspE [Verrucomicrobiota bacterium]